MVALDAALLVFDSAAVGGFHVDHPKDFHHELASHARVVTAGIHDQAQRAKQPDSVYVDATG